MKFAKIAHIEKAVEKNNFRPALGNVLLDCDEERPQLVATDGHILAVVPVDATKEEAGLISPDVVKEARKAAPKKADQAEITCNGTLSLPDGRVYPRPDMEGLRFPQWRQVLPKATGHTFTIGLNAELLQRLADALGDDVVALTFSLDAPLGPVAVTGKAGYGAIMPVRVDNMGIKTTTDEA